MHIDLGGKAALVTGAARGIGRAIAENLARAGASVLLADVDAAALDQTRSAIEQAGGMAATFAGDLTRADAPQQCVEALLRSYGAIDIVVNNAGYTWDSVIQKTTDEQFQAMLDIHVIAPFRLLRAASEFIRSQAKREKEEGRTVTRKVVNITSISGTDGNAGQAGYASGKAAVRAIGNGDSDLHQRLVPAAVIHVELSVVVDHFRSPVIRRLGGDGLQCAADVVPFDEVG